MDTNPNDFQNVGSARDAGASFSSLLFSILGLGLLGGAAALTYWIVTIVQNFLYQPEKIILLDRILKIPVADNLIKGVFDGKEFSLATNDFPKYFLFLFVCFILLSSLGRIVGSLISQGIALFINASRRS